MRATLNPSARRPTRGRLSRDAAVAPAHPWRWVALLTVVGAVLRAVGLDAQLWWDEIYTLIETVRPPFAQLLSVFAGDNQHPLFSLLAHASIQTFGEHAWSLRLPAFLFGVASIPALYLLGGSVASRREGLLAAGFLTVSYHHIWFSQNARGYSALAFWAMVSTYLLVRVLREGRPGLAVAYAATAALGLYTHLTMAFLVVGHLLVSLAAVARGQSRARWRALGIAVGCGVAFTLALYGSILPGVLDFFLHRPSQLRGVSTPSWALAETVRILRVGFGSSVVLVVGAGVFATGIWSYVRRSPLVGALFVLPGVVTIAGALAARGTMYPRFFFFLAGFATLLVIRGAVVAGDWIAERFGSGSRTWGGTGVALVLIGASLLTLPRNYALPKQDFLGALRFAEQTGSPPVRIAAVGVAAYPYQQYYGRSWPAVERLEELQALRGETEGDLVLYTFPRYLAHGDPELLRTIEDDCQSCGRSQARWVAGRSMCAAWPARRQCRCWPAGERRCREIPSGRARLCVS